MRHAKLNCNIPPGPFSGGRSREDFRTILENLISTNWSRGSLTLRQVSSEVRKRTYSLARFGAGVPPSSPAPVPLMTPADAATAMHSYSGHLMQFASGVDTETALFYGRRTSSERT
jgi:hypothetical protein